MFWRGVQYFFGGALCVLRLLRASSLPGLLRPSLPALAERGGVECFPAAGGAHCLALLLAAQPLLQHYLPQVP